MTFDGSTGCADVNDAAASAPLRAIRAALGVEHGERMSLDALSRVLREAA